MHMVRQVFVEMYHIPYEEMSLVYESPTTCQDGRAYLDGRRMQLCVHRKGATVLSGRVPLTCRESMLLSGSR